MIYADAAILEVDLDALSRNIDILQNKTGPAVSIAGIVKADAYGIGLDPVARTHRDRGTRTFFVATPDEGIALRGIIGPDCEIAILGGLFHGAESAYLRYDLTPVLNTPEEISRWGRRAEPAMIHIDTGMRRLGLDVHDARILASTPETVAGLRISAILSHFACADEAGHPMTQAQFESFSAIARLFPGVRKSLCNSAGIFESADYHLDMVRPGMAVYGLNPTPGRPNPMEPVIQIKARILQIRDIRKGDTVGYGASWTADSPRQIATVALGYADGFLRSLSSRGTLFWRNHACPVVGRISMDAITIDITEVPLPGPTPGDWMDVFSPSQDVDTLATAAGTLGYEILTSLGTRYRRTYRKEGPDYYG